MKKKRILSLFLSILFFTVGFLTHAFFFPSVLTNNIFLSTQRIIEKKQAPVVDIANKALTIVTFENGEFDPQVALVGKSYYLSIRNNSNKELMTLTSDNPLFRTPRGYGLSEEYLVQLYDVGEYKVSSALHPDRVLRVIVK